jgi:uncharacterized protein YndB with AHSA1/START domain
MLRQAAERLHFTEATERGKTMADIRHRLGIAAPQEQVYEALTESEGIARWWTRDIRGEAKVGGELEFFFGGPEPSAVMEIVDLVPASHVAWRCVRGPEEWVGTDLTFDLASKDGQTVLLFTHADWREPVEFLYHCSTKWAYFLLGLKAALEGREYTPYPEDEKISTWG